MSNEQLAKLEKEIQEKLADTKTKKTRSAFRVDMIEVKKLAKKLEKYDQQNHAASI